MKSYLIMTAVFLSLALFSCKNTEKDPNEPIAPAETRSTMEYNYNELDTVPENASTHMDFKGSGNEPFWSIEIVDKKLFFQSPDKNFRSISATVNTVDVSGNTITFKSEKDGNTIDVILIEQDCTDGMNGKKNTHKVEVSIKQSSEKLIKTYEGCGSFLNK